MSALSAARPVAFAGEVITPESHGYPAASRNALTTGAPAVILRPADAADVQRAVRFAAVSGRRVAVRGGGHSAAGLSTVDDGIVIDLRHLRAVEMLSGNRVRVGGGALWRQVVETLGPHGLAISSGDTADVGVGGLTLSGGIGWMVRRHGLTLDHLRRIELVTAAGEILEADESHHAELFWALRGGGGGYGIVTAFEFEAEHVTDVSSCRMTFPAEQAAQVVDAWTAHMRTAPFEIGSTLVLADPLTGGVNAPVQITLVRCDDDDLSESVRALAAAGSALTVDQLRVPYAEVLHPGAELPTGLTASVRSGFVAPHRVDEAAAAVVRSAGEGQPGAIILHSLGGAFARVSPAATAFAHRSAEVMVTTFAVSPDDAVADVRARLDLLWNRLAPHIDGAYANSLDGGSAAAIGAVFPEDTLVRLATVKERYDPANLFRRHFGPGAEVPAIVLSEGKGSR